ncbi:MAG TPA: hypothetical protein PKC45_10010, partial [Gemmatales bacterium]|nr:hypothetical protein [Gemmatales bacterium]
MPVAAPPLQDRYQPMSFLAVAALCFGLVAPLVFLIDQPWYCFWVVLPGIFLAVLARRQVLRSDGAVAGYIPATLAAILTVGSGVGWLTKAVVVQAIVDHESSRFLDDWLSKLKQGQIGSAFLDTQRPDLRRVSFAVEDERNLRLHFPGRKDDSFNAYDNFRHNALVNLLQRYGDRAELRYLGKADHGLTAGGEQRFVKHEFELVTPMGRHKVVIRVESDFESILSGRRRGWVIAIRGREVEGVVELLPYVRNLADAVTSSQDRVQKWI